jgi:hypothetical protein
MSSSRPNLSLAREPGRAMCQESIAANGTSSIDTWQHRITRSVDRLYGASIAENSELSYGG